MVWCNKETLCWLGILCQLQLGPKQAEESTHNDEDKAHESSQNQNEAEETVNKILPGMHPWQLVMSENSYLPDFSDRYCDCGPHPLSLLHLPGGAGQEPCYVAGLLLALHQERVCVREAGGGDCPEDARAQPLLLPRHPDQASAGRILRAQEHLGPGDHQADLGQEDGGVPGGQAGLHAWQGRWLGHTRKWMNVFRRNLCVKRVQLTFINFCWKEKSYRDSDSANFEHVVDNIFAGFD